MSSVILTTIAFIIVLIGILGTFLPILPGIILCYAGLLIYKWGNPEFPWIYIIVFGILTLVSLVLNYLIPLKTTAKYGGSTFGKYGGLIGTLVGLFFPPLGFIFGMLLGVFLGELLHDRKDHYKAFRATKGALIGFLYGTGFNLLVGLAMFLVILIDLLQ